MPKLYRIGFEVEIVFASDSDDPAVVREEVYAALRRQHDLRSELTEAYVASVHRIYRGDYLPVPYTTQDRPWSVSDEGGDVTIASLLEARPGEWAEQPPDAPDAPRDSKS